jgi:hypothetical protein
MHSITCNFASHIDSTTLADGDYQLIPEQKEVILKIPGILSRNSLKPRTKVRKILI